MKKLLCFVPALLLFATIGAPNARADSYTPTFICERTNQPCAGITAPNTSFPGPTDLTITVADLGTFTINLSSSDSATDSYSWTYASNEFPIHGLYQGAFAITDGNTRLENFEDFSSPTPLLYSDDALQGSLTFSPASAAAPEPPGGLLMLLGAGLIVLLRKRFAVLLPRAA